MIEDNSKLVIREMKNAARRGCRAVANEIKKRTVETMPNKRGITRKLVKHGARLSSSGLAKGSVGTLKRKEALKKFPNKFIVNMAWLEFGTKPHMIKVSKKKKTLSDGKQYFTARVNHSGITGRKYLTNAAQVVSGRVKDIIANEMSILNEKTSVLERMADDGDDDI